MSTKFKVVVCGAGIGGLTTAVALSAYPNIDVEIYESAAEIADIGAGIGIFPRPWEVLRKLGLDTELLQHTKPEHQESVPCFKFRKSDQNSGIEFYELAVANGGLILLRRTEFQQTLLRSLPKSYHMYCSKRLRSYVQSPSGQIEILFEDGSETVCDVLVGADGLKSAVRRSFVEEKVALAHLEGRDADIADIQGSIDPVWTGTCAYRAQIPTEKLQSHSPNHRIISTPTQYLGKHGYIVTYPMAQGKLINFVSYTVQHELSNTSFNGLWTSISSRDEISGTFRHWEPEVQDIIANVENPLRWAVHAVKPLNSFVSGHVVLIGDAAHAMAPHQGSGAGQAIEDAYVLAHVLGHRSTTRKSLARTLDIYDRIRRPMALEVTEKSLINGQLCTFHNQDFDSMTEDKLLQSLDALGERFTAGWKWAWTTSINESIQEASRLLES